MLPVKFLQYGGTVAVSLVISIKNQIVGDVLYKGRLKNR